MTYTETITIKKFFKTNVGDCIRVSFNKINPHSKDSFTHCGIIAESSVDMIRYSFLGNSGAMSYEIHPDDMFVEKIEIGCWV